MSYPHDHTLPASVDDDHPTPSTETIADTDPGNESANEFELLISRFRRMAARKMRDGYKRRSNTMTPGFRRHQRRGGLS